MLGLRILEIVLIVLVLRSVIVTGLRYLKKKAARQEHVRPDRFKAKDEDIVDAEYKDLK